MFAHVAEVNAGLRANVQVFRVRQQFAVETAAHPESDRTAFGRWQIERKSEPWVSHAPVSNNLTQACRDIDSIS